MFQKRKTSPQLLLEFLQPNINNIPNNRNENQQKLEKLLKDSFSSQKIEIKTQQIAK
jgi:cytidine deaminase